ncbi:asparagine synthase [Bacteroidia bacterium]|nr:asparagine synthase [Bacteroidia bacterium]
MIQVRLVYNKGYKWFSKDDSVWVKGYLFTPGNQLLRKEKLIDYFSDVESFSDFQQKIREANGLFSIVLRKENQLWAVIDHARSFPLFYHQQKNDFFLTDNPDELAKENIPMVLDEESAVLVRYSGFVTGNKTLLKDVFQLIAGQSLCYEDNQIKTQFHTEFLTNTFSTQTREELKAELKTVLDHVGQRMVEVLAGRPVAIPLSGGYDSRLMAYLLRKNNYPNVLCYTFGKNNNIELNNARRTAERLHYPFLTINYEKYKDKKLNQDLLFQEYVDFASNYSCTFSEQDYYALCELIEEQKISSDTVFIPGHSGAIVGDLLSEKMRNADFQFVDYVLDHVFSYVYPRRNELKIIQKELIFDQNKNYPPYLLYENWRFQETTAKFGFHASKIWDFFGFEYLHPLADRALFDFFVHAPFSYKYDKNLYKETLSELFEEYDISFANEELYPSQALVNKVAFRAKLKKAFPFLKRLINFQKNDIIGTQYYIQGFIDDLKQAHQYRKILASNGIFSEWYLLRISHIIQKFNEKTS